MIDARVVANRFLELARENGKRLTSMQLIKLVYIAHGWTLALLNRPLIRQDVEAWQYGPVIRDVYNETRRHGRSPISSSIAAPLESIDESEGSIIKQVFDLYGDMPGIALSNVTHMRGTPWEQTYDGAFGTVISNSVIAAHYRKLAEQQGNSEPRD